ncbi:AfsR/SARP family transcriptional regulator [Nocardia sp. CDC160]|uniref:AfsR/SARP family transcriptional regulator n=1 Tax=Nocardia sp. CDC160 TaxID=3112166 RepID=UPI002DB7BE94|nr:AfsR/SARP family transcriptional regulator [Nocardia sp. CDC160]MEC3918153.1 AfsR/SARP family transcriptional regulator [Nocardia sp. CDC160]
MPISTPPAAALTDDEQRMLRSILGKLGLDDLGPHTGQRVLEVAEYLRRRPDEGMRCRDIGPLEVEIDGRITDLGGPVARRIMAALALADGAAVPDDRLIDQVWGERRPHTAINTLRVAVWRLRAALGDDARTHLQRTAAGYALTLPPDRTDHGRFTTLVDHGRTRLAAHDPHAAAAAFESALELWRGDPWSDLASTPELAGATARLAELRAVALEELQAARLACGDTVTALAALRTALTDAPYRERRWELLALALYRSGRQAEALAELRRLRALLIRDLALEPGLPLQTLEHRMLTHDPTLLTPHATT